MALCASPVPFHRAHAPLFGEAEVERVRLICGALVSRIREAACSSCEIMILDMHEPEAARRTEELGIGSLPAVAIDGELAGCCTGRGPDEATLAAAGLGQPL